MRGAQGADIFQFTAVEESSGATVNGTRQIDNITDFTQGADKIDLSAIDANGAFAGDQAFTFVEPPSVPTITDWTGLVWSTTVNGNTTIFVSTDADADAEMQINMLSQAVQLHGSDFIL